MAARKAWDRNYWSISSNQTKNGNPLIFTALKDIFFSFLFEKNLLEKHDIELKENTKSKLKDVLAAFLSSLPDDMKLILNK